MRAIGNYHWRRHGEHHAKVGEGEIDDEEIAGGAEWLGAGEDVDDHTVAGYGDAAEAANNEAEDPVP